MKYVRKIFQEVQITLGYCNLETDFFDARDYHFRASTLYIVVKACQNVFSFSLYTEAVKLYHYILH